MNQNAYREYHQQEVQDNASQVSARNTHFDELSSSGVESDWILFSPLSDTEAHGDVLSTSTDDHREDVSALEDEEASEIEEEEDDDDSLIESLGTNVHLSLPQHDGIGSFVAPSTVSDSQEYDYFQSLKKEDFVAHRIDTWRKEQAKVMINDLHRHSLSSSATTEKACELLASWGVDDRLFIQSDHLDEEANNNRSSQTNKRFYGDDLLKGYTEWEVNKIKRVAHQLSSSLVRDHHHGHTVPSSVTSTFRARRSSLLLNLSRSTNRYLIEHAILNDQPFWKRDLSSAHSSLSLSTNSIMFGNLNIGEA